MAIKTSNNAFYPELTDLKVGQQYVFYNSLLGATEEFNPYARDTGVMARNYLYKQNIFNPKSDTEASTTIQQALLILEKSWQLEEYKERNYINYLAKKFPESIVFKKSNIDFMDLILELNRLQKGIERAYQYIDYERKRWANYREHFEEIEAAKINFLNADKKDSSGKNAAQEYHALRMSQLGTSIQRKIGVMENQFFSSLDKNKNSIITIIKDVVVNNFGAELFIYKSNGLQIDQYKTAKLINILVKMVYEQLLLSTEWKEQRSTTKKKQFVENTAKKFFGSNDNKKAILDSLKNTAIDNTGIDELRQKLTTKQQKTLAEKAKQNESKLKPLIQNLRKLYKQETGLTKIYQKSFDKWMETKGYDTNYKEQLLQELTLIENIKVDVWFESERKGLEETIAQGLQGMLNGTAHNLKSDFEAGKLMIEVSANTDSMNKEVSKTIHEYEQQLWTTQQDFIKTMKVGAGKNTYQENYEKFVLAREEQIKILLELEESLKSQEIDIAEALTYFNVHTSVKDQTGNLYLDKGSGFTGGALGKGDSALSFIDNIKNIYAHSGNNLSMTDLAWLKLAVLNAGQGLIGSGNKKALEGYFSMFVNFLMFDDAYNIVADAFSNYIETLQGTIGVQDIHLYIFNGIYVPLSYILKNIWLSLQAFTKDMHLYEINLNSGASRVSITTYNVSGYPGFTEKDWLAEAEKARNTVKIKAILMSGFLDLLNQLEQKINSF